jgi:transposase
MLKKRAYRATSVKSVDVETVRKELPGEQLWVGLDIAKGEVLAVVRGEGSDGKKFLRPWKVVQPGEIGIFVECVRRLAEGRNLLVAMESTGTYGDALRQALSDAGLEVHRVSSKAASDYAEIFDGVPSQHDGKDAAIVADLAAIGKSTAWPYVTASEADRKRAAEADWLDAQQDIFQLWLGRLESRLARHWPEGTRNGAKRRWNLSSPTLLRLLAHYGSPQALAEDPQAAEQLAKWGGPFLKAEKIASLLESARTTVGVRMTDEDQAWLKRCAEESLRAHREIVQAKKHLAKLAEQDPSLRLQATAVGATTASVLQATVGSPEKYHCAAAYCKAMGLNLKERSSGKHKGQVKITKRGPARARRWLYFAALRVLQRSPVRGWFEAKKKRDKDHGQAAVIAVMRKLALALWSMAANKQPFDLARLFPGRSPHQKKKQKSTASGTAKG